ncbi:uncharacterized protein LOC143629132 [Bidens hawaiensis]|uniref:uncharacterized protein LOC143629132 n=1 Tax=Bidens hawaiensis TaxID=980011 RepID=UPI00404920F9
MTDFEAPSFSLGLDCDLSDSEPQRPAQLSDDDDAFETLIVDDSEPEYPDSHPNLKRLRHRLITCATSSSPAELHFTAVIDDEEDINMLSSQADRRTDQHCTHSNFSPNRLEAFTNQHVKIKQIVSNALEDLPNSYRYFFHDDPRIQELVRSRLSNYSPLVNMFNADHDQPNPSHIDYMGQFRLGESSKQAARSTIDKKSSTSRKNSRKLETEETPQGWVNPKACVDKATTKGAVKRKGHKARLTAGHWLTGPEGKKVYVGKSGRELTGRVAYLQYKKESALGFKKVKRKSGTKKKK